jgi:hypothetical protein
LKFSAHRAENEKSGKPFGFPLFFNPAWPPARGYGSAVVEVELVLGDVTPLLPLLELMERAKPPITMVVPRTTTSRLGPRSAAFCTPAGLPAASGAVDSAAAKALDTISVVARNAAQNRRMVILLKFLTMILVRFSREFCALSTADPKKSRAVAAPQQCQGLGK